MVSMKHIRFRVLPITVILLFIVIEGCKTPSILATEQKLLGDEFSNAHDYEEAILHYRKSLEASRKLGVYRNMESEGEICRKIAYAYGVSGDFDEAYNYAYYAYRRDSAISNQLGMISDYREMGKAKLYAGDFKQGIQMLDSVIHSSKGMETSLKSNAQISLAETYIVLSQVESVLGKYREALDHARQSMDIYSRLHDPAGISECTLQMGKLTYETGNPYQAEVFLKRSVKYAGESGLNTSRQLMVLADMAGDRAKYEDAIRLRRESIKESEEAGIIPQVIWSTIRMGDTYASLGDLENANRLYDEAIALKDSFSVVSEAITAAAASRYGDTKYAATFYREIGAEISEALTYLRKADIFMERKNLPFALTMYRDAEKIFEARGSAEGVARTNLMKAEIWTAMGQYMKADAAIQQVELNTVQPENLWRMHFLAGKIAEEQGLEHDAIRSYKRAIDIIEEIRGNFTIDELKSIYINNKIEVYDRLINLLIRQGKYREAFRMTEKARARAFLDMIGNKRINFSCSDPELVQAEQDLRNEMQSLSEVLYREDLGTGRGLNRSGIERELLLTREKYLDLLREIKLQSDQLASVISFEPPGLAEFQSLADDHTAFISFWTGSNGSYAWIIRKDSIIPKRLTINEQQISDLTVRCREASQRVSDFRKEQWRTASNLSVLTLQDAYSELIRPVIGELDGITSIGIVPHKILHLLSFQALINENNRFLAEEKNLFFTPSLSTLVFMKNREYEPQPGTVAMALGNEEFMGFSALPGTLAEVENISKVVPGIQEKIGEQASEAWFKENAGRFGMIHLATHGFMDARQPIFSFILLAPGAENDGMLTVNEVFGLQLNADLVTLSACQTGLGELSAGDEMVGLSRAMLYAGTANVIVSLWNVADQQTAELMTTFYQFLDTSGPVEALARAQRSMIREYPAPFYWAPFLLIGTGISGN